MKLSVTIITLNEASNISRCLNSVSFADEIIVVDSHSTDGTQELAKKHGARVVEHPFEGYGQQKNFAASLCHGEWILNIDADEEVSVELKHSILEAIANPLFDAYKFPRLTRYGQHWVRHCGWYPGTLARLYRKDRALWTQPHVHESLVLLDPHATFGFLKGDLLHYSFPQFIDHVKTIPGYAPLSAKDLLIKRKGKRPYLYEILLRPVVKFFECFVLKLGVLDGKAGFLIACNSAYSTFAKFCIAYYDYNAIIDKI